MSSVAILPALQTYTAYGLSIRSAIPLSEFTASEAATGEVEVRLGESAAWIDEVRDREDHLQIVPGEARFWFKDTAAFTVAEGRVITVYPEPGTDLALLRLYVQGMMMAMVLHQRGCCVLHASVVDMGGYAVAFLGHVGAGKSSLAGAMYARGLRVLSDDNAAVDISSGIPIVVPAYPCLKLFPEIASTLGFGRPDSLHESQAKLRGAIHKGFSQTPLPLKRLYILGRDHSPEVTRLSPLHTVRELLRTSAPTRWGHAGDARQLQQCGYIATHTETFTLRTFSEAASLPKLAEIVSDHCGAL